MEELIEKEITLLDFDLIKIINPDREKSPVNYTISSLMHIFNIYGNDIQIRIYSKRDVLKKNPKVI